MKGCALCIQSPLLAHFRQALLTQLPTADAGVFCCSNLRRDVPRLFRLLCGCFWCSVPGVFISSSKCLEALEASPSPIRSVPAHHLRVKAVIMAHRQTSLLYLAGATSGPAAVGVAQLGSLRSCADHGLRTSQQQLARPSQPAVYKLACRAQSAVAHTCSTQHVCSERRAE